MYIFSYAYFIQVQCFIYRLRLICVFCVNNQQSKAIEISQLNKTKIVKLVGGCSYLFKNLLDLALSLYFCFTEKFYRSLNILKNMK